MQAKVLVIPTFFKLSEEVKNVKSSLRQKSEAYGGPAPDCLQQAGRQACWPGVQNVRTEARPDTAEGCSQIVPPPRGTLSLSLLIIFVPAITL